MKVICLPPAGGSALLYFKWQKYCKNFFEITPIEYSGRGFRENEEQYDSLESMIYDVLDEMSKYLSEDYMIFAHSMGCILVFELYEKLIKLGCNKLKHIFFAAGDSPKDFIRSDIYKLNEKSFRQAVSKYGGSIEDFEFNSNIQNKMYNTLRNDLRILNEYIFNKSNVKFRCNISILNGIYDHICNKKVIWDDYTEEKCDYYNIYGNHFFPFDQVEKMINIIKNKIQNYEVSI